MVQGHKVSVAGVWGFEPRSPKFSTLALSHTCPLEFSPRRDKVPELLLQNLPTQPSLHQHKLLSEQAICDQSFSKQSFSTMEKRRFKERCRQEETAELAQWKAADLSSFCKLEFPGLSSSPGLESEISVYLERSFQSLGKLLFNANLC